MWTRRLFAFWLAFFPFAGFLPFFAYSALDLEGPRWIWLNFGVILILGAILYRLVFKQFVFVINRFTFLLSLLFILWLAMTALLGFDERQSFFGSLFRHQGVFTYVALFLLFVGSFLLVGKNVKTVLWAAALSSFFVCILALAEIPLFLFGGSRVGYAGRLVGPFGQPNFLAEYLALLLPLQISLAVALPRSLKRYLVFASIGISTLVILATFSRTGIFGLSVGVVLLAWYFREKVSRKWRLASVVVGGVSVAVFVAALFLLPQTAPQRDRLLKELRPDPSRPTEQRIPIWASSLVLIRKHPFIGWGAENLGDVIASNQYDTAQELKAIYVDRAHSYVLDLALSGGIPLLAILIYFIVYVVKSNFSRQPLLTISVIVFAAMSLTNIPSLSLLAWLWVILGLLSPPFVVKPGTIIKQNYRKVAMVLSIVVLVVIFNFLVVRPHSAALHFKKMEGAFSRADYDAARQEIMEFYEAFPYFNVYEKYYIPFSAN